MDLKKFVAATRPADRRSPATPFRDDILALRGLGYRLAQICEYLELNGVSLSTSALSSYIGRTSAKTANKRAASTLPVQGKPQTRSVALADTEATDGQSNPSPNLILRAKPIDVMKHAGRHVDLDRYSRIAREKFKEEKLKGEKK